MNQSDAAKLAIGLMKEHGITLDGWRFEYDDVRSRLGCTKYNQKIITLSKIGVYLHPDSEVKDTILHEIAHVLAGHEAGHGPKWKEIAARIGATPKACFIEVRVPIKGNTFPVKAALDRLGAKWDKRDWIIEKELLPFANFIVESGRDGKVIIEIENRKIDANLSHPLFCSCESELPIESKTLWQYQGDRLFKHKCGKIFRILISLPARVV